MKIMEEGTRVRVIQNTDNEQYYSVGNKGTVIRDDKTGKGYQSLFVKFDTDAEGNEESWWIDADYVKVISDSPRKFRFYLTLIGDGDSWQEAWQEAVDALAADPGEPGSASVVDPTTYEDVEDVDLDE